MKKLLLTLLLLFLCWGSAPAQVGPPNQILCNTLANATGTGSLATLQAGVAGKTIYICGWHVTTSSGTAVTFQLTQGTGSNCATTSTAITPAYNLTSAAPATDHIEYATLSLPAGVNLCFNAPATVQVGVWLSQL